MNARQQFLRLFIADELSPVPGEGASREEAFPRRAPPKNARQLMARRILVAAIARDITFRVGVLGATDDELQQYASQIVDILERPQLRSTVLALLGESID